MVNLPYQSPCSAIMAQQLLNGMLIMLWTSYKSMIITNDTLYISKALGILQNVGASNSVFLSGCPLRWLYWWSYITIQKVSWNCGSWFEGSGITLHHMLQFWIQVFFTSTWTMNLFLNNHYIAGVKDITTLRKRISWDQVWHRIG